MKSLCLPRLHQNTTISGVAGLMCSSMQSLTNLTIVSPRSCHKFNLNAIVVPRVTCELPVHPVTFKSNWTHLEQLSLAYPEFGQPGRVNLLLGVNIFSKELLHGRRIGPPGLPIAFETVFGGYLRDLPSNVHLNQSSFPITHSSTQVTIFYAVFGK